MGDVPTGLSPTVVTLGNFDGVHRGHREVLTRVVREASLRGAMPVAVTFEPHPVAVLYPDRAPEAVMSLEQRLDALESVGLAAVLVIEFTRDFAQQTPEEFVRSTFVDALGAAVVVVGKDTRFGVRNSGDVQTLRELGVVHGFEVITLDDVGEAQPLDTAGDASTEAIVEPITEATRWSSTQLRSDLLDGNVEHAIEILGRPHAVAGTVVHGDHRGRELGYPTANLSPDHEGLVPCDGVYAGWLVRQGMASNHPDRTLPAAISVGTNPTFDGQQRRVEAYVLDRTDLDLYGERVSMLFVANLRPTLKFDSVDALVEQMQQDVTRCREILASIVPS